MHWKSTVVSCYSCLRPSHGLPITPAFGTCWSADAQPTVGATVHFTQGGRIDGSTHIEVGLDVSDFDYACDVILFSEFTDSAALKAYASHSEHLRVQEEPGGLRGSRFQVDYPIQQETSV